MPRSIDVAYFDCKCGHRSTVPDAINNVPHLMDIHSIIPATVTTDPVTKQPVYSPTMDATTITTTISTLNQKFTGNNVSVTVWGNNDQVIRLDRSYAKVTIKDTATVVTDSNHILLSCPQCGADLYEARWR